jgi:serine/threonine protein kinase
MEFGSAASQNPTARRHTCPVCSAETWSTGADDAPCHNCGKPLPIDGPLPIESFASAVLSPPKSPMDETLTSYLAAPLPEEVLRKSANPANLFGKYVFLHEIGRGATGTVLKGWDTYLSRHVALKFLHPSATRTIELDDSQRVQDFLREARLAARLRHPHIVQIHEVDCREGRYFISMDFIGGGTLAERIHGTAEARTPTRFYHEPRRFLELLHTIALAVHHAHRQSPPVVHRDLKPQNVLLDGQDKPFVADFGLAGEIQGGPLAGAGGVRGTPAYMAPEQALGRTEEIDPRTDVYSLGVILFEMLAGEAPFKGDNIPSVLRKVVTQDPDVPGRVADRNLGAAKELAACPREFRAALDGICLKALSKKREDRYESALQFAGALSPFLQEADAGPASEPPRRKIRVLTLALAGILFALAGVAVWRGAGGRPAAAPAARPGDDLALLASRCLAAGEWTSLRDVVKELRRRAPEHPKLAGLEGTITSRDAEIERHRRDWAELMGRLRAGGEFPDDLERRLAAFPELRADLRSELSLVLTQREASLIQQTDALAGSGPSPAWTAAESKSRAAALRAGLRDLVGVSSTFRDGFDTRPLMAAAARLDALIAYLGTWSLRINLHPFAEFSVRGEQSELAHDFTPARFEGMEIRPDEPLLEVAWPSFRDSRRRWSGRLPSLSPGDTLVVSGDPEHPELRVERP